MQQPSNDFSQLFTAWACQPDLTADPIANEQARLSALDTWACMVAGANTSQATKTMTALASMQGVGVVQPIGGGNQLSLQDTALLNGVRAHALDFDDYEMPGNSHIGAPLFSALFSVAQPLSLSIDQVSQGWIVGYEAAVRMGQALGYGHYDKGWHATATLATVSVAAAVSKALGLSAQQMANAMSIAASSSAGLKRQFGTDTKAVHSGLAAQRGIQAAFLARADISGNCELWSGAQGFSDIYGTPESIGFEKVMETAILGQAVKEFPVARKLWPSCGYTHRTTWCGEQLHKQIDQNIDIEKISIRMAEPFHRVAGFQNPSTDPQARFSVSYCTVVALLTGHVTPEDFEAEKFMLPLRQQLSSIVTFDLFSLPPNDPGEIGPSNPETVTVTLKNGQILTKEAGELPGGCHMPMSKGQLIQKISNCQCSTAVAQDYLDAKGNTPFSETGLLNQQ